MNKAVAILIVILIGSSLNNLSCNNPSIERLRRSPEKAARDVVLNNVVKKPRAKYQYCQREWGRFGTCCDESKLNILVTNRINKWAKVYQGFMKESKNIKNLINANRWKIVGRLVDLYTWASDANLDQFSFEVKKEIKDFIVKPVGSKTDTRFDLDFLYYIQDTQAFEESYASYVKNSQQCFESTQKFFKSMFCYSCSGRASQLLFDNKLRIHVSTCRNLVKKCIGTWTYVYNIMHMAKAFTLFNEVKRKYGTPEASKVGTRNKNTMGPDTALISGVLSFSLRELNQLGTDDKTLFYFRQDIPVCNSLVTVDGGNDDIAGDPDLITRFVEELKIASQDMGKRNVRDFSMYEKKYKSKSKSKTLAMMARVDYFRMTYNPLKAQYDGFMNNDMREFIIKIYDSNDELYNTEKPPSLQRKAELEKIISDVKKEFERRKGLILRETERIEGLLQPNMHNAFIYKIPSEVKDPIQEMYKNVLIISGRLQVLKLPEPFAVAQNKRLLSKSSRDEVIEQMLANLDDQNYIEIDSGLSKTPENRRIAQASGGTSTPMAKDVVSVQDELSLNAEVIYNSPVPGPPIISLVVVKKRLMILIAWLSYILGGFLIR